MGLRTEFLGAWTDGDCHIGNIESDLTKSGTYPFVYPRCVNKLGVSGLTATRLDRRSTTTSTRIGTTVGFAWDMMGHHTTTLRGGYGLYYVREDMGAVDQLSFQSPFIPIVFFPTDAGIHAVELLHRNARGQSECRPAGGTLYAAWIPCLAKLTSFVHEQLRQRARWQLRPARADRA